MNPVFRIRGRDDTHYLEKSGLSKGSWWLMIPKKEALFPGVALAGYPEFPNDPKKIPTNNSNEPRNVR